MLIHCEAGISRSTAAAPKATQAEPPADGILKTIMEGLAAAARNSGPGPVAAKPSDAFVMLQYNGTDAIQHSFGDTAKPRPTMWFDIRSVPFT